MKGDAFAFLRGATMIMAQDLACGPTTDLRVQACGDCHLGNFCAYTTPEGRRVYDVNDTVALAAYTGDDGEFDKAIAEFAMAYADQTTRDWHTFRNAIEAGPISAAEL
jgi:hypothetical protein